MCGEVRPVWTILLAFGALSFVAGIRCALAISPTLQVISLRTIPPLLCFTVSTVRR